MTRIDIIDPKLLSREHLQSNLRELPRITNYIRKSLNTGKTINIPNEFTLGTGHVKWYYNKLKWVVNRYDRLCDEWRNRGYSDVIIREDWLILLIGIAPKDWWNDWEPTGKDISKNISRINQRVVEFTNKKHKIT